MSTVATTHPPRLGAQLLAPIAVMAVVLLMIVPLPPLVLDLLLSVDIGLAVVLLLTVIYIKQPVEFSVFPSLLLLRHQGRASTRCDPAPASTRTQSGHRDAPRWRCSPTRSRCRAPRS